MAKRKFLCTTCNGSGYRNGVLGEDRSRKCTVCRGKGYV